MKSEVLGIRCGLLSAQHRLWGECYMVDLDFIVTSIPAIEYIDRRAFALIEYKMGFGKIDLNHANIAVTEDVACRAQLPFFVVQYDPSDWDFLVRPRNEEARAILPKREWMDQGQYITFLHKLRGREVPPGLLSQLGAIPPAPPTNEEETADVAVAETA